MNRAFFFSVFFIVVPLFFSGCVSSSTDSDTLESRVTSLEKENILQIKKNFSQEKSIDSLEQNSELNKKDYASLKADLRNFKVTIRRLKGVIEETGHKFKTLDNNKDNNAIKQKIKELNDKFLKIFNRIVALEQYIGMEVKDKLSNEFSKKKANDGDNHITDNKKADKQQKRNLSDQNSEQIYKNAKNLLDREEFDAARLEFEKFISLFPDSKNTDNARFWIADSYYKEKWYEKAILEYQKVIENYSTGNKVASALLKQGFSFAELGEKANARLILKELTKKYPESSEAILALKKLETLKK